MGSWPLTQRLSRDGTYNTQAPRAGSLGGRFDFRSRPYVRTQTQTLHETVLHEHKTSWDHRLRQPEGRPWPQIGLENSG